MEAVKTHAQTNNKSKLGKHSQSKPDIDYSLSLEKLKKVMPPMITVRQAAATGIACDRKIRNMCAEGTIPSIKVGSDWRIPRDQFFEQILCVH